MLRYLARRVAAGAALVATLSAVSFFLLYLSSADIARRLLGMQASADTVALKEQELGIDRPVLAQFGDWVSGAVQGDLGTSWLTGQPVSDAVSSRLAVTLSIVLGATIITALISLVLGVLAATRGGVIDKLVQVLSVLGFAIPGFIVALGLVLLFALNLGWFDPTGYTRFADSPSAWLASITLPVAALSLSGIAGVTAQVRGSMIDALRQDYVKTLRSRGLPEWRVLYRHVLRNAAGPALSVLAVQFVGLLGGAVIVESVFAIPGLGQSAVVATSQGDIPLVMGIVLATALIVVSLNLLVDLLQGWLNPKVRLS